ncbi:hypothetical protein [Spartinivicinus ruber]|uniref:hypothetical protein n=1 Tax=Spartinivicinus ruber TaxID=2683272 RepID=UPI0013D250A6|nr:hypothetical protein [Spartinivicinus ruber]
MNDNTPFSRTVAELSKGCLDAELTEKITKVVKAVRKTKKTGSVTLQLKINMLNTEDEDPVKITPAIKLVVPEEDPMQDVLWSTEDGDLLKNDPDQRELDLQTIESRMFKRLN